MHACYTPQVCHICFLIIEPVEVDDLSRAGQHPGPGEVSLQY